MNLLIYCISVAIPCHLNYDYVDAILVMSLIQPWMPPKGQVIVGSGWDWGRMKT